MNPSLYFTSDYSQKQFHCHEQTQLNYSKSAFANFIKARYPQLNENSKIAYSELNQIRIAYIQSTLESEFGTLNKLEQHVVSTLHSSTPIQVRIEEEKKPTYAQKLADGVARFGGSWTFIISFGIFIAIWIIANAYLFLRFAFDPFPFILLNLILSCIAAIQAPIIMMSQNRQEEKDRERAKQDYMINLKAELEIRLLHDKIDHLIINQQHALFEIQSIQMDMMNEIIEHLHKPTT
jgi:uncharacterized membrane protein